ncbi:MAG: ABC transporter permease subunit [Verrucomicrobia bacterium]|nr:ABC transporter permease subunit [Verrucomicrobiota bacterium]
MKPIRSHFLIFFAVGWIFAPAMNVSAVPQTVLRWGADSEGGAPFAFQDPANPRRVIGYEVDLIEAIGNELGVKTEFVQNQWDGLIPGLDRGNYDVAINGIEITPDRAAIVAFSDPYFVTYEQLTVRRDTENIATLKDCVGKVVGTLKATLAERILHEQPGIEVRSYDGQVNQFEDLANGRLDAVLIDQPIAIYYGQPNPKLKVTGAPIGRMSYGIAVRKDNRDLLREVNGALSRLTRNGKLREIYERWGLWNAPMAELLHDSSPSRVKPTAYEAYLAAMGAKRSWKDKARQYLGYVPLLARGAGMTVALSFIAMGIAVSVGLFVALLRLYAGGFSRLCATTFIEVVRGTPLLIQLFLIFYGLPHFGIRLDPFLAAILGLGLNYAAYEAENYRAGLCSIPASQTEAALALGMTRWQSLQHIVIPQAVRLVIPPMTNDFISLLKDSSLVSVITMVELTKVYGQLAATYYDYFGVGIITAAMYLLIGLPFVWLARWAERKFSAGQAQLPRQHPGLF